VLSGLAVEDSAWQILTCRVHHTEGARQIQNRCSSSLAWRFLLGAALVVRLTNIFILCVLLEDAGI